MKVTHSPTTHNANVMTIAATNAHDPVREVPLPSSIEDVLVLVTPHTIPTPQYLEPPTVV